MCVYDLRDAIYGFHFADTMLTKLPTLQATSSSSHIHGARDRCSAFWALSQLSEVCRSIPSLKTEESKEKLHLWYVTSYMSCTTASHFLHYPVSKAAFIQPLPLESAPAHNCEKLTTSCLSFMANPRNAIYGFHLLTCVTFLLQV